MADVESGKRGGVRGGSSGSTPAGRAAFSESNEEKEVNQADAKKASNRGGSSSNSLRSGPEPRNKGESDSKEGGSFNPLDLKSRLEDSMYNCIVTGSWWCGC
jgi:hypothetical protein